MVKLTENLIAGLIGLVGENGYYDRKKLSLLDPGFHDDNLHSAIALLPETTEQVCEILKFCNDNQINVVPQGGRTGLAGGCVNHPDEVIVMCDRLNKIIEVNPMERTVTVEAGVTLQTLEEILARDNLSIGVDIGARGTATIGGMIATNAGGMEAFRHGSMRQRLLGLTVILADGSVYEDVSRVPKCNEGYDIKQLFCGAEGTLGLITSAVLKLTTLPSDASTLLAAVPTASAATKILRQLQQISELDVLRAEIMWATYAQCVAKETDLERVLNFCDSPFYVIYELSPLSKQIDLESLLTTSLESAMEKGELIDLIIARNEREREEIWRIREESFVIDRTLNHSLWYDISVPLTHLDSYVNNVITELEHLDPKIQSYFMGHLGDGNLHATIGHQREFNTQTKRNISTIIEASAKKIGGSFSAEHGIGIDKRESLTTYTNTEKLRLMSIIKKAFDPKGIMNPGKVI